METTFSPSKHFLFKLLLLGIPTLFLIGFLIYTLFIFQSAQSDGPTNIILFSVLAFLGFTLWQLFRLYRNLSYTITNDTFKYSFGISSGTIKVSSIKSISTGRYPAAGNRPALDFNGIKLIYGEGYTIFVAPEQQAEFIQHLKEINPNIKVSV